MNKYVAAVAARRRGVSLRAGASYQSGAPPTIWLRKMVPLPRFRRER